MSGKYLSYTEALVKAQRYCAYQDRCHQEVRYRLIQWGVYGDDLENILIDLIQERFLDEERYARSFARGKFRMKQWGRQRIVRELKKRDISEYCIRAGLVEIEEEEYLQTLHELLSRKKERLDTNLTAFECRQLLIRHGLSKGFEMDLVQQVAFQVVQ
ncbi:MAG: RecX family transcriptional regulator [Saprospirales bacterium]|nr:RecX family transcriptional regulator [Saprospirales bacterium]